VTIPFMDFPVVTPYNLVDGFRHFRETCFLHHQCTANKILWPPTYEVGTNLPGHMATQSMSQYGTVSISIYVINLA